MKSNLLLLLGIPLAFIAVLAGIQTGQPLWFFLCAPLAFVRWLQWREVSKPPIYIRRGVPDRPDLFDAHHTASVDDSQSDSSR